MSVSKSIKRIVRQFCAERSWIQESGDKKREIREKAAGLERGEAVELSDLAGENAEEFAVFCRYQENSGMEEIADRICDRLPQENDYNIYTVVILTETVAKQAEVSRFKRKIRNKVRKKMGCMLSQVVFQALSYCSGTERRFDIDIGHRIDMFQMPEKEGAAVDFPEGAIAAGITAYTCSAKLYDIVKMYNHVGDELFRSNLRYGISEQLDVEKSMKETLRHHPENFWFLNNGITITVRKKSGLDLRKNTHIILDSGTKEFPEVVSVINGAQTITTAAEFWYDDAGVNEADVERVRTTAKECARVLLRIMCVNEDENDCQGAFDQISIALNWQKPIKGEDIAYTDPLVFEINQLFSADESDAIHFYIMKRGENVFGRYQYNLTDFARAVKAYRQQKPGEARTQSASKILEYITKDVGEKYIADLRGPEEAEDIFRKYFMPVNFVRTALQYYRDAEKRMEAEDGNNEVILGNGAYYFVAYLMHVLHEGTDYRDFTGKTEAIGSRLDALLQKYLKILDEIWEEGERDSVKSTVIDSNTFKNEVLYQKLTGYRQDGGNEQLREEVQELEEALREALL